MNFILDAPLYTFSISMIIAHILHLILYLSLPLSYRISPISLSNQVISSVYASWFFFLRHLGQEIPVFTAYVFCTRTKTKKIFNSWPCSLRKSRYCDLFISWTYSICGLKTYQGLVPYWCAFKNKCKDQLVPSGDTRSCTFQLHFLRDWSHCKECPWEQIPPVISWWWCCHFLMVQTLVTKVR